MMNFVFDRVDKNLGRGENAGNHHFLLFPQCFQNADEIILAAFNRVETLWEEKKMVVISIFFFSHNVFKRFLSQGR